MTLASCFGYTEVVKLLIGHQANVNYKPEGDMNPLMNGNLTC